MPQSEKIIFGQMMKSFKQSSNIESAEWKLWWDDDGWVYPGLLWCHRYTLCLVSLCCGSIVFFRFLFLWGFLFLGFVFFHFLPPLATISLRLKDLPTQDAHHAISPSPRLESVLIRVRPPAPRPRRPVMIPVPRFTVWSPVRPKCVGRFFDLPIA